MATGRLSMIPSPFSDNIIFMDTEFTTLDSTKGEILSIGLVKPNGKELYLELEYEGTPEPWVVKHVLPGLTKKKVSKTAAAERIKKFIGDDHPYLMAYVNQFDAIYWYRLFESPRRHPAFWIPIDFASILFAYGFDPESLNKDKFYKMLGVKKEEYVAHNSLDDARMLADVYKKFYLYLEK